jgi:hypothetical protein
MALVKHSHSNAGAYQNHGGDLTFNCTQHASAADRVVVVQVSIGAGSGTVSGITYGGNAMTQGHLFTSTYPSTHKMYTFYITSASSGANNVVVSWGTIPYNYVSAGAVAYTGCSGIGSTEGRSLNTTNLTDTISISAGSIIQAHAIGNAGSYTLKLPDPTTVSNDYSHILGNQSFGGTSAVIATGGSKTIRASAGNGMAFQSVEVQGAAVATPTLTVSETTISGFSYTQGSGPSAEQTFTVSGDDLVGDATATAPTNYEVSLTSGSGFAASVLLPQSGGDITGEPKTVYVRLKSGLAVGTYNTFDCTITSSGSVDVDVTFNGEVSAAPSGATGNFMLMF